MGVAQLGIPDSVARRARRFVGRTQTLHALASWLDEPPGARPWFVVLGGPGTGKSALLAWLAGSGPAPDDPTAAAERTRVSDAVVAAHFCDADGGRAAASLDPRRMAHAIAEQLRRRIPGYQDPFQQPVGVEINVVMKAASVNTMIGPSFGDIHAASAASLFADVLDSLRSSAPGPHLIVVDALDEAELWSEGATISEIIRGVTRDVRASGIRFLVTSRPVESVLDAFPPETHWDLDEAGDADIESYVQSRLLSSGPVGERLAARIGAVSAGNFLIAELFADFAESDPDGASALANEVGDAAGPGEVWKKLDEVYRRFLQREFGGAAGRKDWEEGARPVLGTVAVAREKLAAASLRWLLDPHPDPMRGDIVERALPRCLQYLDGTPPDGPFGLYHFSFREFLFAEDRSEKFSTEEWVWHRLVGNRFREAMEADWSDFDDGYGIRYILGHLADVVRLAPTAERAEPAHRLAELALSRSFRALHEKQLNDPVSLCTDLGRAVDAVSFYAGPDSVPLLTRFALDVAAFQDEQRRPAPLFAMAASGDLVKAEQRLGLFAIDYYWRQAALLACAWLAAPVAADASARLCDRLAPELGVAPLPALLERVRADIERRPADTPPNLWSGPPGIAEFIVGTLEGIDPELDPSMLEFVDAFQLGRGEHVDAEQLTEIGRGLTGSANRATQLRAEREAPFLVAAARDDPPRADPLVKEYIRLHSANSYVQYRNRSLWAILLAVVRHPSQGWVRERLEEILVGALAGGGPEFRGGLSLVVFGLRALAGDADAAVRWPPLLNQARGEAEAILNVRGSDGWAHRKRRLGLLAEVEGRVFERQSSARSLARDAANLQAGFAGYQSPAALTLGESLLIAGAPPIEIDAALDAALASAHNVQDPVYCARTTGRARAMRAWWDAAATRPCDPVTEALQLAAEPDHARYGAVHVVGEDYNRRSQAPSMIVLPDQFRSANTLRQLGEIVYQRPAVELARLNRGVDIDAPFPAGQPVVVPDPDFAALLAARIAADLVVRDDLDPVARRKAAQRLVPVASRHATALDTVLCRLLLIEPAASTAWVGGLAPIVGEPELDGGASAVTDPVRFGPA